MPQQSEPTKSDAPYAEISIARYKQEGSGVIQVGGARLDIIEDGRNTDNRIGALHITLAPGAKGPPQHWHQMHDETFLVLKGAAEFTTRDKKVIAKEGDYVVVPPFAPHTFANASDSEEMVMYNSFTPAYYVNYFRYMAQRAKEEGGFSPEINRDGMSRYATIQTESGQW